MGSFLWSDIEGLSEYLSSLLLTVTLISFVFVNDYEYIQETPFLCLTVFLVRALRSLSPTTRTP